MVEWEDESKRLLSFQSLLNFDVTVYHAWREDIQS